MAHYRLFNAYPSFGSTFTENDVVLNNPIPNYGMMATHLTDYFENQMSETTVSGTDYLSAFIASNKSLTSIVESDMTAMANDVSIDFGITSSTIGYAALDFRGESWKYLIGDGIIGPSNINNTPAFTETLNAATNILNFFRGKYPSIKWAFVGLPHLPKYTCFAPTAGSSFSWGEGLTNNPGTTNNHWDASHPTGPSGMSGSYGDRIFEWNHTPSNLAAFYKSRVIERTRPILEASGWLCPDINPVGTDSTQFGYYVHSIFAHNSYTTELIRTAKEFSQSRLVDCKIIPVFNSMMRSRESHVFDDPFGQFKIRRETEPGGPNIDIQYLAGFSGGSGSLYASDIDLSLSFLRSAMLEPAALNGAVGFIYEDNIPLMVNFACTGSTSHTAQEEEAILRAKNFISNTVYDRTDISLIPWTSVKNEVLSVLSYKITAAQLRVISESIPIGNSWSFVDNRIQVPDGESVGVSEYKSVFWKRCNAGVCTDAGESSFREYRESNPLIAECDGCGPPPPDCNRGACCYEEGGVGFCGDDICEGDCAGNFIPLSSNVCGAGVPITCANLGGAGVGEAAPCSEVGFENRCWTDIIGPPPPPDPCCLAQGLDPDKPCVEVRICSYDCTFCDNKDSDCDGILDAPNGCASPPLPPGTIEETTKERTCRKYRIAAGACCCVDCTGFPGDTPGLDRDPPQCSEGPAGGPPNGQFGTFGGIAGAIRCGQNDTSTLPLAPGGFQFCHDPAQPWLDKDGCLKPCENFASVSNDLCECCAERSPSGYENPDGTRCCNTDSGLSFLCPRDNCFQPCVNGGGTELDWQTITESLFQSLSLEQQKLVAEDIYNFNLYGHLDAETKLIVENIAKRTRRFGLSTMRDRGQVMNTISLYEDITNPRKNTVLNLKNNYLPSVETVNRIKSEFAFDRFLLPISYK
jgi:hypothetical protein